MCARAVAELMSAGEAGSTIVRLRSRFATAAPGTAPLDEERTETRVQRGIGLCAQLAGACDHTVASQPMVTSSTTPYDQAAVLRARHPLKVDPRLPWAGLQRGGGDAAGRP